MLLVAARINSTSANNENTLHILKYDLGPILLILNFGRGRIRITTRIFLYV
jgi:hypothetical protein